MLDANSSVGTLPTVRFSALAPRYPRDAIAAMFCTGAMLIAKLTDLAVAIAATGYERPVQRRNLLHRPLPSPRDAAIRNRMSPGGVQPRGLLRYDGFQDGEGSKHRRRRFCPADKHPARKRRNLCRVPVLGGSDSLAPSRMVESSKTTIVVSMPIAVGCACTTCVGDRNSVPFLVKSFTDSGLSSFIPTSTILRLPDRFVRQP